MPSLAVQAVRAPERFAVRGVRPLRVACSRSGPRLGVVAPEFLDVSLQMLLDLPLGLGEKSEIPALAQPARRVTESQRTRVPQGVSRLTRPPSSRTR